jgi:hypothetical protein
MESCDDMCLGQDYVAEVSGCHDLYQKSLSCSVKLANACTALTDCGAEINATYACELAYCNNGHRGTDACANVM